MFLRPSVTTQTLRSKFYCSACFYDFLSCLSIILLKKTFKPTLAWNFAISHNFCSLYISVLYLQSQLENIYFHGFSSEVGETRWRWSRIHSFWGTTIPLFVFVFVFVFQINKIFKNVNGIEEFWEAGWWKSAPSLGNDHPLFRDHASPQSRSGRAASKNQASICLCVCICVCICIYSCILGNGHQSLKQQPMGGASKNQGTEIIFLSTSALD